MREREREREIERISSASKPLKINQVNIPLFNYIYNQVNIPLFNTIKVFQ